ncbi:MAG: hypothetical protein V3S43_06410 [Acidimicrobiia bacterium]
MPEPMVKLQVWFQVDVLEDGFLVQVTTDEIVDTLKGRLQNVKRLAVTDRTTLHAMLDTFLDDAPVKSGLKVIDGGVPPQA